MSARSVRVAQFVLTLFGLGIAGYLVYVHYADLSPFCGTGGLCSGVRRGTRAACCCLRSPGLPISRFRRAAPAAAK